MADTELSDLTQAATLALTDLGYVVTDPSGAIASKKSTLDYILGLLPVSQGILTLESGVPVSTTDQIDQSTIYFTPFKGNIVRAYDGARWRAVTFAEVSLVLSGLTLNKLYDIWGVLSGSTIALEKSAAWTSDTARSEALALQDGIPVKSGDATRLYLGTFRATSTTATTDSAGGTTTQVGGKRFLWNEYNAVDRHLLVIDTADIWAYTTDTWRQANGALGAPLNCVEFIIGRAERMIQATLNGTINGQGSLSIGGKVGIGVDSITTPSGLRPLFFNANAGAVIHNGAARYQGIPAVGYHYLAWLEKGPNGTSSFVGDSSADGSQSGMYATVKC